MMSRASIILCFSILAFCLFRGPLVLSPQVARADDRREQAETLIKSGEQFLSQNDLKRALIAFKRGLELGRAMGDELLVSRCLAAMSGIHISMADTAGALSLAEEALSAARRSGDLKQEAKALTAMGDAHFYLEDSLKALEYFQGALQIMTDIGDRHGEAAALKDIGITCRTLGWYEESLESLNEALVTFREEGDTEQVCSVLSSLGTCYDFLGAHVFAADAYEQAIEIARKNGFESLKLTTLTRMGYLCINLGRPERALTCFREAEEVAASLGMPRERAWALMGMGGALSDLGQLDAAIEMNLRSLEIYKLINSSSGIATNLRDLGNRYLHRDPDLAAEYFRQALEIPHNPLTWTPYHGLARVYRLKGDLSRSIAHYEAAIERIESIRGRIAADQHRTAFAGKHQEVYQELIDALIESHERDPLAGFDRRAYGVFERIKARAMLEAISAGQLDDGEDPEPELREREEEINRRIAELQKRLIRNGLAADERRRIVEELSQAERDYDGLMVEIKLRNPRYALRRNLASLSLEDARHLLGERAAMVAYMVSSDRVSAFVITAHSFHVERLPASPKLVAARVENLTDLISEGDDDGWKQVSACLYQDLVEPITARLATGIDRLIIIPDGPLHYLPFEILIREAQSRYLLEDFTISYAPSATVLAQLTGKGSGVNGLSRADLVLFADPLLASDLLAQGGTPASTGLMRALYEDEGLQVSPIPFSASEAKVVGRHAGPGSAIYTGIDASESRLKTDRLDRYRIIHFATHGLVSQQRPARSALVLASGDGDGEDGFLQAREIYGLSLASDLVVLSACQTALGRVLAGEGVEGLARAFFYAGAKSVVASLWDVRDEATAKFMEVFYRHLSEGEPKAEALRKAKLEMIRDEETSSPR
ncbi:MAG TPA: CHAT domain-containing tetratricopeptide repeat protein, partial [Blastocatellia bacterium]|nr:CHAT domain-containing tetratricopeptide repeat protein [Blastocatellia bacterium]